MNIEFWNSRYTGDEYAYGVVPNAFFKEVIDQLAPGKILLPAEGEGRNAVYAAIKGWDVTAFDISVAGKNKAEQLAAAKDVSIRYVVSDFQHFEIEEGVFDCLALIFAHTPPEQRRTLHRKLITALKPGGLLILQGFSKKQLQYKSGGPKEESWLFSIEDLLEDFSGMDDISGVEETAALNEGPFHQGEASLISLTARR